MNDAQRRDRRLVLGLAMGCFVMCSGLGVVSFGGAYWFGRQVAGPVQIGPSDRPEVKYEGVCEILPADQLAGASAFDAHGFPHSIPDPFELRALLEQGSFARLNAIFEDLQAEAERDFRREGWINTAFMVLSREEAGYEPSFDAWVQAHPDSAVARIARARHRTDLGWLARGHAWASKTSQEQFDEMRRQFRRAYEDVEAGLQLNSRIICGHLILIELANAGGSEFGDKHERYATGLELFPNSSWLRGKYMNAILPRWGGSYREMKRFADEWQEIETVAPSVRAFYGWIPWDQATLSDDQEDRIRLCTTALSYAESSSFLQTRADAYLRLDRFQEAFADYNRALELWPLGVHSRATRAELHAYLGRLDAARADLAFLERFDPSDPKVEHARSYIAKFRTAESPEEDE